MSQRVQTGGLQVAEDLYNFITNEALPETGVDADQYWAAFDAIVHELAPRNRELLAKRDDIQAQIDSWHKERKGQAFDLEAYKAFLTEIGYLLPEGPDFTAETSNVDPEMATMAGPQLVVPVMNARFALNAANARWGSLYDALYGTDAVSEEGGAEKTGGYNPARGAKVIEFARNFLNESAPLASGSHKDSAGYSIKDGALVVAMRDGGETTLADSSQLVGYTGNEASPTSILFKNNGLHFELQIDRDSLIGKDDAAGVKDIQMESALTTIMDCEDSVAAVDAPDKVLAYRN